MTPTSGANTSTNSKRSPRSLSEVTIVLDAGHEHKDSGAVVNGVKEVDFTRKQTAAIKKELESRGYKVVIASDRSVDKNGDGSVSNEERALFANKHPNPLFISIHADSGLKNGTTLYYPTEVDASVNANSQFWASGIAKALGSSLGTENQTGKGANGGLTKSKNLKSGSAIFHVEVLNLKDPTDRKNAQSQEFIDGFAKRFVDALVSTGSGNVALPKIPRSDVQKDNKESNNVDTTSSTSQSVSSGIDLSVIASIGAGNSSSYIKAGKTGVEVVEVKKLLNTWLKQQGRSELVLTPDCDAEMVRAIKDFQKQSGISKELKLFTKGGLVVDGVVGPWTLTALLKANGIEDPQAALAQYNGSNFDLVAVLQSVRGGVFVDSISGEPDWDALADLQFNNNQIPVSANPLTDAEIASRDAPKAVKDALDETYQKFKDFDYGWGATGENGRIDCSAFVSWYLRRLGLRTKDGSWRQTTLGLIDAESVFPGQVKKIDHNELREGDFIVWVGQGDKRHTGVVGPDGIIYQSASKMGGGGVNDNVSVSSFIATASKYKQWACFRPIVAGEVVERPSNPVFSATNFLDSSSVNFNGKTFRVSSEFKSNLASSTAKEELGTEGLIDWNASEPAWASLGIMHATWGKDGTFAGNSFSDFIEFAKKKNAPGIPSFLTSNSANPWASRSEFLSAKRNNDPRMVELQRFLENSAELQTDFMIARFNGFLETQAPKLSAVGKENLLKLLQSEQGIKAAIMYVSFKGEGTPGSSTSWGLSNVLERNNFGANPVVAFTTNAKAVLESRHPKYTQYAGGWTRRLSGWNVNQSELVATT
jgi:N-acetylmuramoyl-L-alanine amidase/cell wall-associated NlpC family hydrolase